MIYYVTFVFKCNATCNLQDGKHRALELDIRQLKLALYTHCHDCLKFALYTHCHDCLKFALYTHCHDRTVYGTLYTKLQELLFITGYLYTQSLVNILKQNSSDQRRSFGVYTCTACPLLDESHNSFVHQTKCCPVT